MFRNDLITVLTVSVKTVFTVLTRGMFVKAVLTVVKTQLSQLQTQQF